MGQYYLICNLDKEQFLHPHNFGDGLKLLEFGCSQYGTMLGLSILLADGNGRGGGDLDSNHHIVGSWRRDRIVVAGDYADVGFPNVSESRNLYAVAHDEWQDISDLVIEALCDDLWLKENLREALSCRIPPNGYWSIHKPLPQQLLDKLNSKSTNYRREEPPHLRLARAVLRAPDDPSIWHPFIDACLERDDVPEK